MPAYNEELTIGESLRSLLALQYPTFEVVARFLAVLELYREGNVVLEQAEPLGDLYVTWSPGAPAAGESNATAGGASKK